MSIKTLKERIKSDIAHAETHNDGPEDIAAFEHINHLEYVLDAIEKNEMTEKEAKESLGYR